MTKSAFPSGILNALAYSVFRKKSKAGAYKRTTDVRRIQNEAATPAQTARLNGVFGR